MAKLPQDFADLLTELCEANAEFLLVGGRAVILHGHVRATDDMDVFVRPSRTNSERVFAALEAFGAPLRAHAVAPGHFATEGDAYRFGIAPLKVEVLTKISGVSGRGSSRRQDVRLGRPRNSVHRQARPHCQQEIGWSAQGPRRRGGVRASSRNVSSATSWSEEDREVQKRTAPFIGNGRTA